MAGVFGQASRQFSSPSVFGSNFNSSQNPFGFNSLSNTASPTIPNQSSVFGGSSTGVFGASNPSFTSGSFGSSSVFGSNSNSSCNPFAPISSGNTTFSSFQTQGSTFRESSTGVFGAPSFPTSTPSPVCGVPSGQFSSSSVFGSTFKSSQNPFAFNSLGNTTSSTIPSQCSVFGGNSTGVFAASNPPFTFGKVSGSSGSSSVFGSNSISSCNPFAPSSSGNTAFPSFQTQGSIFRESSTGAFGAPSFPASTQSPGFGIAATAASGSSTALGPASSTNNNTFFIKPIGNAPTFVATKFAPSTGFLNATGPINPFAAPNSAPSSAIISGSLASLAQNKGSKIASYNSSTVKEGDSSQKLISISAMPVFGSKSHEELRWEDYELKSEGKHNSGSQDRTFSFPSPINPVTSTNLPFTSSTPSSTGVNASIFQTSNSGLLSSPTPVFNSSKSAPSNSEGSIGLSWSWLTPTDHSTLNPKPLTQLLGIWPSSSSRVTPIAPINQPSPSKLGHNPFSMNDVSVQPAIAQVPTDLATRTPLSTGNNIGTSISLDNGLPKCPQPFVPTSKATDSIIAVKDPFGPQPAASCSSNNHLDRSSIVQHGISSMPVSEKPKTARISSFLTTRHSSHRPLTVHVRKYHPKPAAPKVAFFDLAEETHSTQKEFHFPTPRENPRSVFSSNQELPPFAATKDETSPTNDASLLVYKDDEPDEQIGNPEQPIIDIKLSLPKLQRSDYYTYPAIDELLRKEATEPGFCSHVKDFVVGRRGYGWVKFEGETDVRGLDLDALVQFNDREVIVYTDDKEKPPVGHGLNKPAEVTLLNIRCSSSSDRMVDKFVEKLRKVAEEQGAEFVSFDPVKGEWVFRVAHF